MRISMIPRAEIALVAVQTGSILGDRAVPDTHDGALVFVLDGHVRRNSDRASIAVENSID